MVDYIDLINAMADTLRRIPQLVADLDPPAPDSVVAYVDILNVQTARNSISNAIYRMRPGTVMVAWSDTLLTEGEIEGWTHHLNIYVRAQRQQSPLRLINDVVNGVPDPGDGLRWRYCPVMDGLLPTTVPQISRLVDEEGIDYFEIQTETKEIGDT